jgi:SAM-dependent methyltransferase
VSGLSWLRYAGWAHECPVCGARLRRFIERHPDDLPRARCPRCGSLQRHRHLLLYLREHTDLLDDRAASVLHFAPDPGLAGVLGERPEYVSADLEPGAAMRVLDLQHLDLPDASFDWIICLHVLEHVPDDRAAMREMARVLRPGGRAVVQSPLYGPATDEDPSVTDPAQRLARFGQHDHVRIYGRDFYDRLRDAGLEVEEVVFRDELPKRRRDYYGLTYHGVPIDFDKVDEAWSFALCTRP